MKLSNKTVDAIKTLFSADEYESVKELLLVNCSNNVAGCEKWSQIQLERVWFSTLKISGGSIEKLYSAIALAQTDYRDLFMSANFGHDTKAHLKWIP